MYQNKKFKKIIDTKESKPSDEWRTPSSVFEYINDIYDFTVDGCSNDTNKLCKKNFTKERSFLDIKPNEIKNERIWINPPYSFPLIFVEKAIELMDKSNCLSVMLLRLDSSTKWFNEARKHATEIWLLVGGRIAFITTEGIPIKGNNFSSVVLVFDPKNRKDTNATVKLIETKELTGYNKV